MPPVSNAQGPRRGGIHVSGKAAVPRPMERPRLEHPRRPFCVATAPSCGPIRGWRTGVFITIRCEREERDHDKGRRECLRSEALVPAARRNPRMGRHLLLACRAAQNRQQDGAKAGQQSPSQQRAGEQNQAWRKVESKVMSLPDNVGDELSVSHVSPPVFD